MYRLFLLTLLFAVSMPVFAERTIVTQSPVYNPYYGAYYGGDYSPRHKRSRSLFSDINELEKYAMNKNFTKDSDRTRLERLETLTFGAVQEGDIYTRYDNVRASILSRPKQNYKTSLFRNISDFFNGQLTGFTPQINNSYTNGTWPLSQNINTNPYEQSSYTQYRSPWGSGYRTKDYGIGTRSGVHFLD